MLDSEIDNHPSRNFEEITHRRLQRKISLFHGDWLIRLDDPDSDSYSHPVGINKNIQNIHSDSELNWKKQRY